MPMFLKELHKVWIGQKAGDEMLLYSGLSPSGYPVLAGFLVNQGYISTVFAKNVRTDFDTEIERAKTAGAFQSWICQDYTVFDSPAQQEEAAQVRGMLLDNDTEKEALQVIQMLITNLEEEKRAHTETGQFTNDIPE